MISGVSKVSIEVEDQDRAKEFWINTMRFELVQDSAYGEDQRWLEVRSPDGSVILILGRRRGARPNAPDSLPTSNVFFYCDDLPQTYEELTAMGVEFPKPPVQMSFGWWSLFQDQEGNRFALVTRGQ